jgi:hypothetical protein
MKVEYELDVKAVCPVDDKPDVYLCTVRSNRTIPVEEILATAERYNRSKVFQEDLTASLCRDLQAEVETIGSHSGVRTRCVCGGPE